MNDLHSKVSFFKCNEVETSNSLTRMCNVMYGDFVSKSV